MQMRREFRAARQHETAQRLQILVHGIDFGLKPLDLNRVTAPLAADDDLLRIHPKSHIDALHDAAPEAGSVAIDGDTHMSPGSLQAAYRAAGGVLRAVDMVLQGDAPNAFAAVRPPGHHAETQTAMGFCLFGNVALGAKHALDFHGLKRVAVVDFDVHHGNGTQDLLWDEPRALTITSQQMPLWPGTGAETDTGAYENVINIPLPPESDGKIMRAAYEARVFPKIKAFKPELILVSAGFDAHRDDPLAQLNWSTDDFTWLSRQLCALAGDLCRGRLVSALEGGYDLEALAASVKAHVEILSEAAQ